MKVFLLNILLSVSLCSAWPTPLKVCTWENSLKDLIQKLTPNGQKLINHAFSDLTSLFYVTIQPVFDATSQHYDETIRKLTASIDAPKFEQVKSILGVGNYTAGFGANLPSFCQNSVNINSWISGMRYENQMEIIQLLNFIETGVKRVMPTILATHKAQDRHVYEQLINSDNPTILNAIASAFEP